MTSQPLTVLAWLAVALAVVALVWLTATTILRLYETRRIVAAERAEWSKDPNNADAPVEITGVGSIFALEDR